MITIDRKSFRAAVALCHSPESASHPDFGLITIGRRSEDGQVSIEGADDVWRVQLQIPAEGAIDGPVSMDAEMLRYIAGSMGSAVMLTPMPGDGVDFFADTVTGMLRTYATPGEGSPIPILQADLGDNPPTMNTLAASLADALELVGQAASVERTRLYLGGVYLERLDKDQIGLTATDGHKLMHLPQMVGHISTRWRGSIILRDCLPRLIAFLRFLGEGTVQVYESAKLLRFWGVGTTNYMDIQPIAAGFPDWRRVVPAEDDAWTYHLDVEQFQTACRHVVQGRRRRGVPMAPRRSWAGAIELDSSTCTLHAPLYSARREDEPSMLRAACHLIRGNRRILRGLNLNYLRTVADLLEGAKIGRVCPDGPGGAIAFRGDNGAVIVLMPMRVEFDKFGIEGTWE